jgi:hypothetical protein
VIARLGDPLEVVDALPPMDGVAPEAKMDDNRLAPLVVLVIGFDINC